MFDFSLPWWVWFSVGAFVSAMLFTFLSIWVILWAGWPRKADALSHKVKKLDAYEEVSRLDDHILNLIDRRKHIVKEALNGKAPQTPLTGR